MDDSYKKLSRILRISAGALSDLDLKMSAITGQKGVISDIAKENEIMVDKTLIELGLDRSSRAEDVYHALIAQLDEFDKRLFNFLDQPDLEELSVVCGKLCETALKTFTPPKGLFIKKEKAIELLSKHKPENIINHFGYDSVEKLIEKEGFSSVMAALRFAQDQKWMHSFFDAAYSDLRPEDFEEREVEVKVLEAKWLKVAEKFLKKKYHNVSHLKEYGIIFIIPLKIDTPGETLRLFTLLLHYLHEVPFYSSLFRKFFEDKDFNDKFKSLLRGDVPSGQILEGGKIVWRIIQRYIAKDNENDVRLFEPHVNPEAEHWFRAEQDLGRLSRIIGKEKGFLPIDFWTGLDFVGDYFQSKSSGEVLVSFDLIDLTMSLVDRGRVKYLYHHEEALWNKIFSEYLGREKMNQLIDDSIIKGFIEI